MAKGLFRPLFDTFGGMLTGAIAACAGGAAVGIGFMQYSDIVQSSVQEFADQLYVHMGMTAGGAFGATGPLAAAAGLMVSAVAGAVPAYALADKAYNVTFNRPTALERILSQRLDNWNVKHDAKHKTIITETGLENGRTMSLEFDLPSGTARAEIAHSVAVGSSTSLTPMGNGILMPTTHTIYKTVVDDRFNDRELPALAVDAKAKIRDELGRHGPSFGGNDFSG